jgi:hypothetical protein
VALLIAYLAAERPISFSLVDRECENAQQQYYDARDRVRQNKNQNPSAQDHSAADERNHADVCAQKRMADAAEVGFWLLLFSLLAAGGAAVAAWWTVSVMRDTAQREMRAYVGIYSGAVHLFDLSGGGKAIRVNVDFKNEGPTPAYDFTTWIKCPVIMGPDAVPFGAPTPISERSGTSILAPHTMAHTHWTFAVSDEDLSALQAGTKRIFAWGGADYTDAFGHARYFRFRCLDNLATSLKNPGDGVGLSPHKLGYDANWNDRGQRRSPPHGARLKSRSRSLIRGDAEAFEVDEHGSFEQLLRRHWDRPPRGVAAAE